MFIKSAYQNRVNKEVRKKLKGNQVFNQAEEIQKYRLQKKAARLHQIGSIKNNKINYDRDEHFFAIDDIPPNAKTAHDFIKDFIDPDFLRLRKKA